MSGSFCPFCRNPVDPQAMVCGSCQAQKGYWQKPNGEIWGSSEYLGKTVYIPLIIAGVSTWFVLKFFPVSFGAYTVLAIWDALLVIAAVYAQRRMKDGPFWYRRRFNN